MQALSCASIHTAALHFISLENIPFSSGRKDYLSPNLSLPPAISAILWSTDRARNSPCSIQHTMKHHGPLLNGAHGAVTWEGWATQAAKHWQTPRCWINIPFVNYLQVIRNDDKGKTQGRDLQACPDFECLVESMSGTWSSVCWRCTPAENQICLQVSYAFVLILLFFWWFCQLVFTFPMSWHSVLNMLMGYCRHCCHDLCSTNETICWVSLSLYMPFQALIPWDHTGKAVTALIAVPSCDFRRWLSYRKSPFSGWDAKLLSWTLVTFEVHRLLSLTKKA